MLVSILHRITGNAVSFVGLPILLWWLGAIAAGPEAYEDFVFVAASPVGYFVLVGLSWAFFNHTASGIRHFFLDIGAGYEIETNKRWSIGSIVIGILLTLAFWAAVVLL
jgi:succinate dehydrogenase / fumarate reductase cytochrome b subunit